MSADGEKREEESASETPPRRVRFPYARIAIGVIGILLSVWLWVGESWRFDVTPEELVEGSPGWGWRGGWVGRYVRVVAPFEIGVGDLPLQDDPPLQAEDGMFLHMFADGRGRNMSVVIVKTADSGIATEEVPPHIGRVFMLKLNGGSGPVVDTARGRWTAKSVLAVLIFLWGVGIIVASVWVWRKRREAATADVASAGKKSSEG